MLPNQRLTKFPSSVTFFDVIDVKTALILGNLLISFIYFQNPAYRLVRQIFRTTVTGSRQARDSGESVKSRIKAQDLIDSLGFHDG
jgi:hypothetical protein